jgi:internalin A
MMNLTKNMKKVLTILFALSLLLQISSFKIVSARESSTKTFAQWCQQKNDLSSEAKYTIDVLLRRSGTKDCQQADRNLSKLNQLNLNSNQISDSRPLASLHNLTQLNLNSNQISDIRPLASWHNLTQLGLGKNKIVDIRPLASLHNLIDLDLASSQISDIRPLASLHNLTQLDLFGNQISDIRPLASLSKATQHCIVDYTSPTPLAP